MALQGAVGFSSARGPILFVRIVCVSAGLASSLVPEVVCSPLLVSRPGTDRTSCPRTRTLVEDTKTSTPGQ